MPGSAAYQIESELKVWLRDNVGTLKGTTENWSTGHLEVSGIQDLLRRAGISLEAAADESD